MNKRKLVARIFINIISVIVLILAVYMLMFEELNQWQKNLSTALVVVTIPVIVIPVLARAAFNKYDNLLEQQEELWEEEQENTQEKNQDD